MANRDDLQGERRGVPAPDFVVPGIRCALEMIIVGSIVGLIGLPASSALHLGVVLIAMTVSMVVVLFWALNRHMAEWIRRARGKPTLTDGGSTGRF
jgi:hypothetical protein